MTVNLEILVDCATKSCEETQDEVNMLQLNPPLILETPKGRALAYFLINYGFGHTLHWVCAQEDTGQCGTYSSVDVKFL